MSDPRVLILGPALDATETASSLERLVRVVLPGAIKYVVAREKHDIQQAIKTFNPDGGYSAEPAHLQTLAAWAETPRRSDPRFRDGYDLWCLRALLNMKPGFTLAVILRSVDGFQESWPRLRDECAGRIFVTSPTEPESCSNSVALPNLVVRTADARSSRFLDFVSDFYAAGAAYGLEPYSLDQALEAAVEALQFEEELSNSTVTLSASFL